MSKEVLSYPWSTFISDVGGLMGGLLGVSVWGLMVLVKDVAQALMKRVCKEK